MQNVIVEKIHDLQNKVLSSVNYNDPLEARKKFSSVNFCIICILNKIRLEDKFNVCPSNKGELIFSNLKELNILNNQEYNFIYTFIEEYKEDLYEFYNFINLNNLIFDISNIYEIMLAHDLCLDDYNNFHVNTSNSSRDRSGAYYTSQCLAEVSVRKTVSNYIKGKLLLEKLDEECCEEIVQLLRDSKVVDLSCGTGNFLKAYLAYVFKKYCIDNLEDRTQIIKNIYGFDIDICAIHILRVDLVLLSGEINNIEYIRNNIRIGNTLLDNDQDDIDLDLLCKGFIYNKHLGIKQTNYIDYFDIIVGNPPWEKVRFEDKNFFSTYCPSIASINKKNLRLKKISELAVENPNLFQYYQDFVSNLEWCKETIKQNNLFELTSKGELNTYALFTELALKFLHTQGEVCLIVKSSLLTSTVNSNFFKYLLQSGYIDAIYDFINRNKIFPIDSRERFAVIYLKKSFNSKFNLMMMCSEISDIESNEKMMELDMNILGKINPQTYLVPNIDSIEELTILLKFYNQFEIFDNVFPNARFGRLVHFTTHADYIHKIHEKDTIPIYEGKFIEIYDNKYSTFADVLDEVKYSSKATSNIISPEQKYDHSIIPVSRFFIDKDKWMDITKNYNQRYTLYWRSLTSASNKRTMIATILPHIPTSQSLQLLQYDDNYTLALILALFNSCIFDFLVKLKLNGIDLTQSVVKQIPVPPLSVFEKNIKFKDVENTIKAHIFVRLKLIYANDIRMNEFIDSLDINIKNPDLLIDDLEIIKFELDMLIAMAYDINSEELTYIMNKFPRYYSEKHYQYLKRNRY